MSTAVPDIRSPVHARRTDRGPGRASRSSAIASSWSSTIAAGRYRQYRDECVRIAHFLLRRLGPCDDDAARPRGDAAREPPRAAGPLRRLRLRRAHAVRRQHGAARRDAGGRPQPVAARDCWSWTSASCRRSSRSASKLANIAPGERARAAHQQATAATLGTRDLLRLPRRGGRRSRRVARRPGCRTSTPEDPT